LESGAPAELITRFTAAVDDDLNISAAWAAVFDWIRETNKRIAEGAIEAAQAALALSAWAQINSVLGISTAAEVEAPPEIVALLEARQAARKARDFKRSDEIRDELKAKGWVVEDSPKGAKLKKM
jgi:cysteinyl-tRNA synthetase